jgi:hypothetical protein
MDRPIIDLLAAQTAIGLNYTGYAAQAAKVANQWRNMVRGATKTNADMSYAINKKLHGATVRARPLAISHVYSPITNPKVGVAHTSSAEMYAPDGQGINVLVPQWTNGYKTNIAGATTPNYTPVAGDVGKRLSVTSTPSTASRTGITHISRTTGKVAA